MVAKEYTNMRYYRFHKIYGDIAEVTRENFCRVMNGGIPSMVKRVEEGEVVETDFCFYARTREQLMQLSSNLA